MQVNPMVRVNGEYYFIDENGDFLQDVNDEVRVILRVVLEGIFNDLYSATSERGVSHCAHKIDKLITRLDNIDIDF